MPLISLNVEIKIIIKYVKFKHIKYIYLELIWRGYEEKKNSNYFIGKFY